MSPIARHGRIAPPVTPKLADPDAERARRDHDRVLKGLLGLPAAELGIIEGVELADGVETKVAHRLGRVPRFVTASIPRGAVTTGRIDEIRDGHNDRREVVVLKASGFGATITVDLVVL